MSTPTWQRSATHHDTSVQSLGKCDVGNSKDLYAITQSMTKPIIDKISVLTKTTKERAMSEHGWTANVKMIMKALERHDGFGSHVPCVQEDHGGQSNGVCREGVEDQAVGRQA